MLSAAVTGAIMNKGNTDMTAEMGDATFPLVHMVTDGGEINPLFGYVREMDLGTLRDSITPIGADRTVSFRADTYGTRVNGISFELRSRNGARLIEAGELKKYSEHAGVIEGSFTLKDLIEKNREYSLTLLFTLSGQRTVRYCTNVIVTDTYAAEEKCAFVKDFHYRTRHPELASEITKYLEPDETGDNSTFARVTIHSNLKQILWEGLETEELEEPELTVTELAEQTGSFLLRYRVRMFIGTEATYYNVEEYYRLRYTPERTYLLDYDRTMHRVFNEEGNVYTGNKIVLGITERSAVELAESDGGSVVAFTTEDRLLCYNSTENRLAVLFGLYDRTHDDPRYLRDTCDVKILSVEETGNVLFLVYGYMSRGRREGEVGLQINYYNSAMNTIEEQAFLPYDKSRELLKKETGELCFMNRGGDLFFMRDGDIYMLNAQSKQASKLIEGGNDGAYRISEDQSMIAYLADGDENAAKRLVVKDLTSLKENEIEAGFNEYIRPLGFMGKDLIYGLARVGDIVRDNEGRTVFPMYRLMILGEDGSVLMQYGEEGVYVTQCDVTDNQIRLTRLQKGENGEYEEAPDDQIMNVSEAAQTGNGIEGSVTESYETIYQLALKNAIDEKQLLVQTPKEVLFEDNREIALSDGEASSENVYYVYAKKGLNGIYHSPANAVNAANALSGVVVNRYGDYVWYKGNKAFRNQIMRITQKELTAGKDALAVCLDTMLEYEGLARNTEYLLADGKSAAQVLSENLENAEILDLTGVSLDTIEYYLNLDLPVLTVTEEGREVLLTGFNDIELVVMDPTEGTLEKRTKTALASMIEAEGNIYLTYIRRAK